MAKLKKTDRYSSDESYDLTPLNLNSVFTSANSGSTKRQSKIANELTEKDPAISQAWSVRVASIASAKYEIVGDKSEFITQQLKKIQPSFDTGMVSFNRLLKFLQSANLHGFATAEIDWGFGDASINGFNLYAQSLFSFNDSDLPVYEVEKKKFTISSPRWIYHTASNSRESEPLRSGLVRPLGFLYAFRRHVQIEYLRGLEKYGVPLCIAEVESDLYDETNPDREKVMDMLENMTYDGWGMFEKDRVNITFPTANNGFNAEDFKAFLEFTEKQVFRLILGQDSTSSADNSNRSTAQVHNLVRKDILLSDAAAVEETINNQIIKPLYEANFGLTDSLPVFRFKLKDAVELQQVAGMVSTLAQAGYEIDDAELLDKFGFALTKKVGLL